MKRIACMAWFLFASSLLIGVRAEDVAKVATQRDAVHARPAEQVLNHVPADAFVTVYVRDVSAALSGPLGRLAETLDAAIIPVFEWVRDTADGPALLTIAGAPFNPFSWRITLIAGTTADRASFVDGLERNVLPIWNKNLKNEFGTMQVSRSPSGDRVMLLGRLTTSLELGFRDGYLIATSVPGAAPKWDPMDGASDDFVLRPEWKDLTEGMIGTPDFAALVDLRAIMPTLAGMLDAQVPNLGQSLQVGLPVRAGFAVGSIAAKSASPEPASSATAEQAVAAPGAGPAVAIAPIVQGSYAARISVFVDRTRPGPWRFLAGTASPLSIAEAFPADTVFLVRGGMSTLADQWENIAAVLGGIDEEIAREARDEAREFEAEIGFNPYTELLANFVDEWAVGGRLDEEGPNHVLMAFRLADSGKFRRHLEVLRKHYDLHTSRTQHRGATVETAERSYGPFSFAIHEDLLLISSDEAVVARALDALMDDRALDKHEVFQQATSPLGEVSWLVYLNGASLLQEVHDKATLTPFAGLLRAALADPGIALGVRPTEHGLQAEVSVRPPTGAAASATLVASFGQAREQARQMMVMSAMKGVLMGCHIYANENRNVWPASLEVLITSGLLGEPAQARALMAVPRDANDATDGSVYYLYRAPAEAGKVREPSTFVVLSEPELRDGGAAFGFLDGHVEHVDGPRAKTLLAEMRGR